MLTMLMMLLYMRSISDTFEKLLHSTIERRIKFSRSERCTISLRTVDEDGTNGDETLLLSRRRRRQGMKFWEAIARDGNDGRRRRDAVASHKIITRTRRLLRNVLLIRAMGMRQRARQSGPASRSRRETDTAHRMRAARSRSAAVARNGRQRRRRQGRKFARVGGGRAERGRRERLDRGAVCEFASGRSEFGRVFVGRRGHSGGDCQSTLRENYGRLLRLVAEPAHARPSLRDLRRNFRPRVPGPCGSPAALRRCERRGPWGRFPHDVGVKRYVCRRARVVGLHAMRSWSLVRDGGWESRGGGGGWGTVWEGLGMFLNFWTGGRERRE